MPESKSSSSGSTSVQQHFVEFFSPGTLFAETTRQPIEHWDTKLALSMASAIVERYDAKPYGFRFSTRARGELDLDSHEVARSPMYYFGVKIETRAEVEARATEGDAILITNMRVNKWEQVVTTTSGWKCTVPLLDGDVVLGEAVQP